MTISELGSLGELISAIGVVASVIYLAIQIHQNTNQLKRAEVDGIFDRFSEIRRSIYESSDLARIYAVGKSDPHDLETYELARFFSLLDGFFVLAMQIWGKAHEGVLPLDSWDSIKVFLQGILNSPGGRVWWSEGTESNFAPEFREEMERLMEEDV